MPLLEVLGLKPPQALKPAATPGPTHQGAKPQVGGDSAAAPPVDLGAQLAQLDGYLSAAKADIAAIKTPALKKKLEAEFATFGDAKAKIQALAPSAAVPVLVMVLPKAQALAQRAAGLKAGEPDVLKHQKDWAQTPLATLKKLVAGKPAELTKVVQPDVDRLARRLPDVQAQIDKGDFKQAEQVIAEIYYGAESVTAEVTAFALDHPVYQAARDKADKAIKGLKSHQQARGIQADIELLEKKLREADAVIGRASDKRWAKATTALQQIPELAKRSKTLADELEKVAAKLPALTKSFTDGGADAKTAERMATYAQRMLVEEKCSDAEAIKLAKEADGFVKEGLAEADALMSSRVKRSLVSDGTPEDVAQEIGKNLRVAGTSSAEDAKAVAKGMKKMSKPVLASLNKAGIVTECCRGPVTEAIPELAGVQPRGWPEGSTWDSVPGVYSGSAKKVVVGTMSKGGKRHVPGPGEGPIPHGTPDLIGHEGGHAFDVADGGYKSQHPDFLAARAKDVKEGKPKGMYGPRDNYFLTEKEGGTNNAGSTSETFAESFAMHFGSANKLWPELEKFWVSNPWGA